MDEAEVAGSTVVVVVVVAVTDVTIKSCGLVTDAMKYRQCDDDRWPVNCQHRSTGNALASCVAVNHSFVT